MRGGGTLDALLTKVMLHANDEIAFLRVHNDKLASLNLDKSNGAKCSTASHPEGLSKSLHKPFFIHRIFNEESLLLLACFLFVVVR